MKESIPPKAGLEMAAHLFELARRDPNELAEMLLTDDTAVQVLQNGLAFFIKWATSQMKNTTDAVLPLTKGGHHLFYWRERTANGRCDPLVCVFRRWRLTGSA